VAVAILLSGCASFCFVHRSEADIRASLIKRTPVGTSRQNVEACLKKKGWQTYPGHNGEICAFLCQETGTFFDLSNYQVYARWEFDKNDILTNVYVYKTPMSL
jgi:hypothetical protein